MYIVLRRETRARDVRCWAEYMRLVVFFVIVVTSTSSWAQGPLVAASKGSPGPWPLIYRDESTKITVRVEADGRHLYATDSRGKFLWRRNPFEDANLEPYRYKYPRIVWLGALSKFQEDRFQGRGRFASISFNSTQFGAINIENGEFIFLGQD